MASGLATRCSACGTVFRVVPDQLRVSEGWVRCGRCSEVFNALEGLVDLDTGLPQRGDPTGATVEDNHQAAFAAAQAQPELDVAEPAARPGAAPLPPGAAGTRAAAPLPEADFAASSDDRFASTNAEPQATGSGAEASASANAPGFLLSAERAARWRSPRVRALLGAALLLGLAGLAAQVAYEYRDLLAARHPEARPLLEQACAALGCKVEPARVIGSLSVDSSGLVRVERSSLYKLQVTVKNNAGIDLAVPALDLSITDTQGRLIARKVLTLAELGVKQATIPAGRELMAQATLQAQGETATAQPVAGYTIELFYP